MARYSIRKNRIKSGCLTGFTFNETSGELILDRSEMYHCIFLRGLDSTESGADWGRISFNPTMDEDIVYCVYAAALDFNTYEDNGLYIDLDEYFTDDTVEVPRKLTLLKRMGAKRFVGTPDMLLYELQGRYLFFALEVSGEGDFTLTDLVIDSIGDNFMNTFPEIYKERNSFFHRYMSVFSSIYNDFGREIDALPDMLNLDTCSEELLIEYGSWMGIDLRGGFLETKALREIVKEAYSLNKMKGTRRSMERILKIILGEDAIIIEHNLVRSWLKKEKDELDLPQSFKPKSIYDVTVLVKNKITEELRHQLMFMLQQFIPARTRINIAQMDEHVIIDSNTYLDINARLPESQDAVLDEGSSLDGTIVLS